MLRAIRQFGHAQQKATAINDKENSLIVMGDFRGDRLWSYQALG
ncbi:hypothetical protein [Synechocystis sp. PCC 7339]|nr:hypothetical protein [Synechocystis sp. PCC 7339]